MPAVTGPLVFFCNLFLIMEITEKINLREKSSGYEYNLRGIRDQTQYLYGAFGVLIVQALGMLCIMVAQVRTYAITNFDFPITFIGNVIFTGLMNVSKIEKLVFLVKSITNFIFRLHLWMKA